MLAKLAATHNTRQPPSEQDLYGRSASRATLNRGQHPSRALFDRSRTLGHLAVQCKELKRELRRLLEPLAPERGRLEDEASPYSSVSAAIELLVGKWCDSAQDGLVTAYEEITQAEAQSHAQLVAKTQHEAALTDSRVWQQRCDPLQGRTR